MTGIELDITRYTSDGIKAFLYSMTDILLLTVNPLVPLKSRLTEQTVVCPKLAGHPRRFDKLLTQYQPIFPPIENQKKEEVLRLPNDAVSPGCFYKAQPLPPAGNGKYIGLYVSNVLSPSVFWIQLRGTDTTLALEDVMDDLERVYTSKTLSKDYLMPLSLAKKGTPCAVIFPEDGFWHRGIITGQQNKLFEVYYVDYGNTCIVSIDQLRLLRTKFLKLPAQAVRARLSNIQPVGGVWKSNSKDKLLDMSREVALVALVTNVKDGVLSLCLTDTNDKDRDVHINDVLVQEGYAYFQPDKEVPQLDMHTQAPSMDLLYGDDEPPVSQEEQPKPTNYRYIRQAQITDDCVMHLINLDGSLYLLSFEISSLFFDDDIISSMLKHDNFDVPKVVISKVKHPDLFNELLMYGVQKVTEDTNLLSLFSLSVMPLIIEFYGRNIDFTEVKETILEILDWFNPDDPYWKGENDTQDETDTSSSLGDSLELPKLEDLQLVLNTLNIKRKRILSKMASEVHCTPEDVNELTEVELHLKRVEKLISKLESRTSSISSDVSTTAEGFRDPETLNLAEESDAKLESKSTQKVAPIVQENLTSLPTPVPTVAAPDLTAFLLQQRQLMMNSLIMMESLGLTVDPSIVQASVSPSSLGVSQVLTNQQLQQQALQSQLQRQQGSSALANVQDNSSSTRGQGRGLSLDLFSQQPNLSDLRSITQGSGNSLLQNQQLLQESLLQQQQMNALNARIAELTLGRQAAMMNPMNLLMGNSFLRLPNFQQTAPSVPNFQQSAPSVASSGWCNSTSMLQQPTLVSPQSPASSVNLNGRPTPRAAPGLTANALEQSQLFQLQQSLGSQPFSRGTGGSILNVTPRTTN
ncbi:unnamed protein product [Lymnaea stagnalis]|uniref:Tudor domain-containing protein n=1 Tax=Lymnaea stagnalis TaxID=6523 RepID=A0AAV2I223_LYMST